MLAKADIIILGLQIGLSHVGHNVEIRRHSGRAP